MASSIVLTSLSHFTPVEGVYDSSETGDGVRLYRKQLVQFPSINLLRISFTEEVCTLGEIEILVNVEYVNLSTYPSGRLETQGSGVGSPVHPSHRPRRREQSANQ